MKILITGGGCREAIDGVRFVTNMSTGRTAAFLADALSAHGAEVTAIMGAGAILPRGAAGGSDARGAATVAESERCGQLPHDVATASESKYCGKTAQMAATADGSECCGQTAQNAATADSMQAAAKADGSECCRQTPQSATTAAESERCGQIQYDVATTGESKYCGKTAQIAATTDGNECCRQTPQGATTADDAQTAQDTATADGGAHCKLPPQSATSAAEGVHCEQTPQTVAAPFAPVRLVRYESGAELSAALEAELTAARAQGAPYTAVIHAAAVSDFVPDTVTVGGVTYRAGKALKKLHSGGDMTVTFRAAPKIADRLRDWAGSQAAIFCFKLTNGATADEQQKATDGLFAHSSADYVIKNDLTRITADQHPFAIAAADGTIAASGKTLSDMAHAVAALCKDAASSC